MPKTLADIDSVWSEMGSKQYELSNHLGNVIVVITDQKIVVDTNANDTVDYFLPNVITAQDYYPFGMLMPGRKFSSETYRFGFNSQEKDNEIAGEGNSNTAQFWQYDTRLGRRWNVDPMSSEVPGWSPFRAFYDNPISFSDPTGLLEDWVQNNETGEFEWNEEVTSAENTPEGYTYVGESDQDIVDHLFGKSQFSTSTWDVGAIGFDDFDNPYSSKGWASYNISVKTDMNISLSAYVEYGLGGTKEFKGINTFVSIVGDVSIDNHPLAAEMRLGKGADMLVNGTQLSFWKPESKKSYFSQGGDITAHYTGLMSSASLEATHGNPRTLNFSYSGLYSTSSSYLSDFGVIGVVFRRANKTNLQLIINF